MRRALSGLLTVLAVVFATLLPAVVRAAPHESDTVRIAVVAHIPLPDSLVSDSIYVTTMKNRAVGAVMLGLNMSGVRWTDAVVGLQYAKSAAQLQPTGRSSSATYWRLGKLARDSGSSARQRLRLTNT